MGDKLRVLVVDDEEIVGKRLRPALEKVGLEVETCTVGEAAVKRIRETPFDIVVTDLRMEGVDGLGVLQSVLQQRPETRVILMTGYATAEVAREALSKGAFEVIAKPFQPHELREAIDRAVKSLAKARGRSVAEPAAGPGARK